ncbi:MAG: AMIN domain-containing protein, partial [Elusimicrobia bacterium]|nr:AMIN domain-containing protein [Elusimicrobiota bacterium]
MLRRGIRRITLESSRRLLASALSASIALAPGAAFAQDAAKPGRVSLQAIETAGDQVILKLTAPAKYNTFVTANPPRLVLELLNTDADLAVKVLEGRGKTLKRVRAGQFAGEPSPIARIVLDLNRAVNYRVGVSGSDLIVKLEGEATVEEPKTADAKPAVPAVPAAPAIPVPAVPVPPVAPKAPAIAAPPPAAPKPAPTTTAKAPASAEPQSAPKAEPKAPAQTAAAPAPPPPPPPPPPPVVAPRRDAKAEAKAKEEEEHRPFSTDASSELQQMGKARRGADVTIGPAGASLAQGIPSRHRRDILRTLPRDLIPSFDVDDVDVRDVMRMLASRANINLIYGPEVSGTMSVHLERVPFNEAFNIVLSMNKLVAAQVGENILQITTPEALSKSRDKQVGVTRVFPVYYGKADDMKASIDAVRNAEGRKGNTQVDAKNNSLIITETPDGLAAAERLLAELDTRPRQVLIEAKLVEVKLTKDLAMGVQWDYFQVDPGNMGGKFGYNLYGSRISKFPNPLNPNTDAVPLHSQTGVEYDATAAAAGAAGRGTGVSLPADKVFGAFTLGRITNNYILSATLTAAASQGKVKVLSDPKIATINGKAASINITNQLPYVTSSVTPTGTVSTAVSYVTTGIQMTVKPTINADGRITLEVEPEVSQPTTLAAGAGNTGAPGIDKRQAKTTVVVRDGETIVIGGLITDSVSNTEAKVPFFGDIPILGWLFRKKTVSR